MSDQCQAYLETIKLKLAITPIVTEVVILQERHGDDAGFFRAQLWLVNGDFLEVAEFFRVVANSVETIEYRYQWMDSTKRQLRKRWDNAPHYPQLPNFPHHVADEIQVESGEPMSIVALIDMLERQL
ncbi:MAG TPA: DUF6516 family protein [Chloroflexota bacterium]|nr:DUF6516 family protein [Chloroflexota bacterium]